jgi:hypothetical protein
MEVNRPDVLAEVTAQFLAYEDAINSNDIAALDAAFLDSADTVRFGIAEQLWSYDAIKAFRRTPNTAGKRRELVRYAIVTYGDSLGVANAVFRRAGVNKIGRQSQTWVKFAGGWKVVSAHVSLVDER